MDFNENNITNGKVKNDTPLNFENPLNYLRDILTGYRTQLQTLDSRLSYVLAGNGVTMGVELLFLLSPNQCESLLRIPLVASISLMAISAIIAVVGNLSGYFLILIGRPINTLISKPLKGKQDSGAIILDTADDSFESLKLMTEENLLKRMFQEKNLYKRVINIKLRLLAWASWLLIVNFCVILVITFIKYCLFFY